MVRTPCGGKAEVKKGAWSEEDAVRKAFIEQNGITNWITLPTKAGLNRGGKSCWLRWVNYLRPGIKHGSVTEEEENTICQLVAHFGTRWSRIAAELPGRTDNELKNYWNTRLKKKFDRNNFTLHTNNRSLGANRSFNTCGVTHGGNTAVYPSMTSGFQGCQVPPDWHLYNSFPQYTHSYPIAEVRDSSPLQLPYYQRQSLEPFYQDQSYQQPQECSQVPYCQDQLSGQTQENLQVQLPYWQDQDQVYGQVEACGNQLYGQSQECRNQITGQEQLFIHRQPQEYQEHSYCQYQLEGLSQVQIPLEYHEQTYCHDQPQADGQSTMYIPPSPDEDQCYTQSQEFLTLEDLLSQDSRSDEVEKERLLVINNDPLEDDSLEMNFDHW
ncbi:hypothetical protein R1flu_029023 [Riccia fluitans]|uniref:Uncharacterized protein n=1 Tax=Riccia fluitans TaxID=41844 RepID=A0ABD1XNX9_9MARC